MKRPRDPVNPPGMGRGYRIRRTLTPREEADRERQFIAWWLLWKPTQREIEDLIRAARQHPTVGNLELTPTDRTAAQPPATS